MIEHFSECNSESFEDQLHKTMLNPILGETSEDLVEFLHYLWSWSERVRCWILSWETYISTFTLHTAKTNLVTNG